MGILNQIIIYSSKVNIEYNLYGGNYKLDGPGWPSVQAESDWVWWAV